MDASAGTGSAALAIVPVVQNAAPTAGQTVVMTDDANDGTLVLTPAGVLATLTVTLPSEANSRIGQIRRLASRQAITALTLNGATTILNGATALLLNDCFSYQKVAANTWVRLQ